MTGNIKSGRVQRADKKEGIVNWSQSPFGLGTRVENSRSRALLLRLVLYRGAAAGALRHQDRQHYGAVLFAAFARFVFRDRLGGAEADLVHPEDRYAHVNGQVTSYGLNA